MCGIFGIRIDEESKISANQFEGLTRRLLILSESRGRQASGLALSAGDKIEVIKCNLPADRLLKSDDYRHLMDNIKLGRKIIDRPVVLTGHSRLVTNGSQENHFNNHPIIKNGMALIHNGIIVNDDKLWQLFPGFRREGEVDTEIIADLLSYFYKKDESLLHAVQQTFRQIEGAASIAALFEKNDYLLLATNTGSLYIAYSIKDNLLIFASEKFILQMIVKSFSRLRSCAIRQIRAGEALLVKTSDFKMHPFGLFYEKTERDKTEAALKTRSIIDLTSNKLQKNNIEAINISKCSGFEHLLEDNSCEIDKLRRCTKCLLPETFPFITFDERGVCNFCASYKKREYKNIESLKNILAPFRRNNKDPDIIVCVSGGRDSIFTLHYLKTELNMNPVAYTYDWGMVTDLARRNISRVTSKLGIEHILISADIAKKLFYIKKNILAWLERPRLGTVPLFMAGDKQMFYYANMLRKRMAINLVFFGMNPLERTDFKVAFCGFREKQKQARHYQLSNLNKLKLIRYYAKEILLNPAYINVSLLDDLSAFFSFYFIPHDYYLFYDFFKWDEGLIVDTIIREYGWETADDTPTTWRIGDGTASFYNYIYYTVAGFSESDTFRSNQIREGLLERDDALKLVRQENKPRFKSILYYSNAVGIDFPETIRKINSIPKIYRKNT